MLDGASAKLYESYLGYKDLEDFLQNFWEDWALSKGNPQGRVWFHRLTKSRS